MQHTEGIKLYWCVWLLFQLVAECWKLPQISWSYNKSPDADWFFLLEFNTASIFNLQVSKTFFGTSLAPNFVPAHLWVRFFHSFETGIARAIFPLNYLATQLTLVLLGPYIYVFQDRFKPYKMTLKMKKLIMINIFRHLKPEIAGDYLCCCVEHVVCWCMATSPDTKWRSPTWRPHLTPNDAHLLDWHSLL